MNKPQTPVEQSIDINRKVSTDEIHGILNEIDTTYNGKLELSDYLQVTWWGIADADHGPSAIYLGPVILFVLCLDIYGVVF